MKVHMDCIPCFLRQGLQATRFVTDDPNTQERVLRRVMENLYWMQWSTTPPEMAHVVHNIVREETGTQDPYGKVKKQYNDIALGIEAEMRERIIGSDDPLMTAVKLAIAGNIIDFGAKSDFDLKETINQVLNDEMAINDLDEFVKALESAKTLMYNADNTGEIVLDKLLLETILDNHEMERIVFVVKGAPIINDATMEDMSYVGLDKIPNIEFMEVGIGVPGTGMERSSPEFADILNSMDTVISKGQGNYEALSEYQGVFFLLMAKCPVLSGELDVTMGSVVLKKG